MSGGEMLEAPDLQFGFQPQTSNIPTLASTLTFPDHPEGAGTFVDADGDGSI